MLKRRKQTKYIVIHCSATPPNMDIGAKEIDRWHRAPERSWLMIGYHLVIRRDGTVEKGRDLPTVGAHAKGYNSVSVGVCLVGGVDKNNKAEDNFTEEQWASLKCEVDKLKKRYKNAQIKGHAQLNPGRACPSFDVQAWVDAVYDIDEEEMNPKRLPILKMGSEGNLVARLQGILGITQDGIFGPQTQVMVTQFQIDNRLDNDGIVGPLTWGALLK